jgi:predicted  nucleic acid-binding Zn-ribbon protein
MSDQNRQQDASRQRNELQRELIMIDSDLRGVEKKKTELEAEVRKLKKTQSQIAVDVQLKQAEAKKLEFEVMQLEAKIREVRKKINAL